jgi:manganese oxidase
MFFLNDKVSKSRIRAAEDARRNRQEVIKALCTGQVSRRDLFKWGIFTAAGGLMAKSGFSPFVGSAHAGSFNGVPSSPLFGAQPFTEPMPRADVLQPVDPWSLKDPVTGLPMLPTRESNQTLQMLDPLLAEGWGPKEGRPPGPAWAHQGWDSHPPKVAYGVTTRGLRHNKKYNPHVEPKHNCGIDPSADVQTCFNQTMPDQNELSVWTMEGTLPPKLVLARYGEPILFRHHNDLPREQARNGGFGIHTLSTHEHNGHHGAESDGFTGAFFYPGQYYDYHWPLVHAGFRTTNTGATDKRCGAPDGHGGIRCLPGDWRETMSTHWFHDHMFSFTSQNVYKGCAAMMNIYSSLDRGNEAINDGVNLRLPSGSKKDWGNLEYDVNLMLSDKAWGGDGQLHFDIFNFDGFVGDRMTVNLAYKPYMEVEPRKYRFRILNGSVARFFKLALSDGKPMIQIGNDGNLLPKPITLTQLDEQAIAERYDIVIDFSRYAMGSKLWMVNLAEQDEKGLLVNKTLSISEALSGRSDDPCVGKFLEFRVVRPLSGPDLSQVPPVLIPNPDLSAIPIARTRTIEFGKGAKNVTNAPQTSFSGIWGQKVDGGVMESADFGRASARPKMNTREVWVLKNGGGGWDHPIHVHFEEGQILARNGSAANVPAWEKGRKDVYRLRPGGSVTITLQFRDWGGMFMEHCHNTVHEDNAMLLRWDLDHKGTSVLKPMPTPIATPHGVTYRDSTQLPNA